MVILIRSWHATVKTRQLTQRSIMKNFQHITFYISVRTVSVYQYLYQCTLSLQPEYHLAVVTKECNIFKWNVIIVISYFCSLLFKVKKFGEICKRQWNGKNHKSIFYSISKVLCLTLMIICLSICLFNYITICYSIFSTISGWQLPFKKSVNFSQCLLKYI